MKKFWGWMVVMVAQQCECTQCHWTVHLKKWLKWQTFCEIYFITVFKKTWDHVISPWVWLPCFPPQGGYLRVILLLWLWKSFFVRLFLGQRLLYVTDLWLGSLFEKLIWWCWAEGTEAENDFPRGNVARGTRFLPGQGRRLARCALNLNVFDISILEDSCC